MLVTAKPNADLQSFRQACATMVRNQLQSITYSWLLNLYFLQIKRLGIKLVLITDYSQ